MALALCLTLLPATALAEEMGTVRNSANTGNVYTNSEDTELTGREDSENDTAASAAPLAARETPAEENATAENAAAVVNDTNYYNSFDEAYAAARSGDTIRLLKDTDKNSTDANRIAVAQDQSLTIDLNSYDLYRNITVVGTLTLKGDNGGATQLDITVLGTLIVEGKARIETRTLTLGSAEQGGTLDVRSDDAQIGATVKVVNKGGTKLTHGKFSKFTIEQENIRIMDLLAEGYAFFNSSGVWKANKSSKVHNDGYVVSVKSHTHSFSKDTVTECACGYACDHELDPDTGACIKCHTQFKKAHIGSESYDSLGAALNAAQTQDNCIVTLLCDTTAQLKVDSGTFTIDLDGHTWKGFNKPALTITGNAALTVRNGTIQITNGGGFDSAIKLDGGSLMAGERLICRDDHGYGIYIGSGDSVVLADDTVLLGGVYFSADGKVAANLLPEGTAFKACSVSENGAVQLGAEYITNAYTKGIIRKDMAVVPHTHDFGTGTCVCGLTAAAEVNGTVYQTLAAAIEAANGNIVKLLADNAGADESITVAADKTLTVELNGKTLAGPVTVLGTLRLDDQSDSGTNGTVSDLTVNGGALEIQSGNVRVTKLTATNTDNLALDKGQFHEVTCPTGETLLSVLKEGYAFRGKNWNQSSFANPSSSTYTEVVECDHPSTIWNGAPVSPFEDSHCKYCNYACTHDQGFPPVGGGVGKCPICGFSAAAYVMVGLTGQTFASLNEAIAHANSSAAGTTNGVILQLYTSPPNSAFTATGRWTLDFKQSSLNGANITVGSDGTANGDLNLRKDYGTAETGTVTVTSGSKLSTEKLVTGNGQLTFTSLTVRNGARASLGIGHFQSIRNENTGGTLADLLPGTSYAFTDTSGNVINAYKVSTADNVTVVPHTHNIDPETHTCACGLVCDHSEGYLSGVCKRCGYVCPHPNAVAGETCSVCQAKMIVKAETGGKISCFTDLASALGAAVDGTTVTLLADIDNTGKTVYITGENKTIRLNLNGKTINGGWIKVGRDQDGKINTSSTLKIIGSGSFITGGNIEVSKTGTLDLRGWGGGENDTISMVTLQKTDQDESELFVGEKAGTIGSLGFFNWPSGGIKTKLNGGTYGQISITVQYDSEPYRSMLAAGCAFQYIGTENYVEYHEAATNQDNTIRNIKVVKCPHAKIDKDGNCAYCNATGIVAQVTTSAGKSSAYTDIAAALSAAQAGDTLKLLKDVQGGGTAIIDKAITFNLNGNEISNLRVQAKAIIKDSATKKGSIGTLEVSGDGLTLGDLLEKDYAFRNNSDTKWVNGTGKSAQNVSVRQVPIASVTLRAVDADNKDVTTPMPYGATKGIKLSAIYATMTDTGESGTSEPIQCKWYTVGGTLQPLDGVTGGDYPLPAELPAGEHSYRVTFAAGDYSKSAEITITVTKATPTGKPTYKLITSSGKTLADAGLTVGGIKSDGQIVWVDKNTGTTLDGDTVVEANKEYKWVFTPDDIANYEILTGTVVLYAKSTPVTPPPSGGGSSSGGSSSGGSGSSSSSDRDTSSSGTVKTETTKNSDGSVTKTETKKDGTKVETTTGKDGGVSKTTTNPNGSSVTETKAADGSTGTVKTDKNGQTEAAAKVSGKAIEDAKKSGEAVKAPVEVEASRDSKTAPTVKVELPKGAGETKVEIPVSNVKPGTVAVLVHPDGTEEIVKNSLPTEDGIQLTVNGGATVKIVDNSKDFIDTRNHWAKDAIDFVSARGLVNGMNATIYAPNASTTRAQLWTILARQNDADLTGGSIWYEKAQLWSKDKGISDGTNPNGTINRAQMVTMLWRTMGQPAAASGASFADVPADSYYAQAVAWAVENGITSGVGGGRFDPNATCTRAQIATFLWRAMAE